MLKKLFHFFLVIQFSAFSQTNLVINPSFESYTACPNGLGEVIKTFGWDTCKGSADYFNICGGISAVQTPKNLFGSQYPANGNSYCGFICYDNGGLYREILVGQLTSSLVISQKYYISFKLNRADSNYFAGYSINKIGAKFSVTKQSNVPINNNAHFFTTTVITDTVNWTRISGSFVADSAYKFIMLGNFFDDTNTIVINDGVGPYAYYYIDDVCISTDSLFSINYNTYVSPAFLESNFGFYPNPANDFLFLKNIAIADVKIFDKLGNQIFFLIDQKNLNRIDCSNWASGDYFMQSNKGTFKIIIHH